jgi:RNA recognition motif-containing protein
MTLYISNLDSRTTEKDISDLFSEFGHVRSGRVRTILDSRTKGSNTFTYIEMDDADIALRAIEKYDQAVFLGRIITIEKAG